MNSLSKLKSFRNTYRLFLPLCVSIAAFISLILPIALRPDAFPLSVGQVSPSTVVAPYDLTFISDYLTEKARTDAVNTVKEIYLPADPGISRTQLDNLRLTLNYIESIRSDTFSSLEQKKLDLMNVKSIRLLDKVSLLILSLDQNQWQTVSQESLSILEQILRNNIRDYQLEDYKNSIPSYINFSLSSDQSELVQVLVGAHIVPNSLFSEEETQKAQEIAKNGIIPISKTYVSNQTIISRGQIVSQEQFEALTLFGLTKTKSKNQDYISSGAISIVTSIFVILYFQKRNLKHLQDLRSITVISLGFIVFLYAARFLIPNRTVIPFFFPLPAYALILAALFNLEIAIVLSLALSIFSAFGLSNSFELTVFYIFTSFFAAIILGNGKRFSSFIFAAIAIAISGSLVVLAFELPDPTSDFIGLVTLSSVSFLNGIASSSIALLIQYLLAQILGLPTPLHLMDLSRTDHPLQKYLLQYAPGTFQHSLQVSNLAEQAAESIGANSLLTRVGTIYHDVGKATNASFFVENQIPGHLDPHDDMDAKLAAKEIINHVHEGAKLAAKYHLPPRIRDFIFEHHGTQITRYPYNRELIKQKNDASKIDENDFRYPGPIPQSKETAILMLADGCEARARAELPTNENDLRILVDKVFDKCIKEGQLQNSPLSLKDLQIIKESFISTLKNSHHPRMVYPETNQDTINK